MFVIYGVPDCKYCQEAKNLLKQQEFTYVDLNKEYKDWKQEVKAYKLGGSFGMSYLPFIFYGENSLESYNLNIVTQNYNLIGNYFDLVEYLEEMDDPIKIGSNY